MEALRRQAPAPAETDVVTAVAVGTALWALAFVVLLPFLGWLRSTDRVWWLAVCGVGVFLGLLGLPYCRRRQARAQRGLPDSKSAEGVLGQHQGGVVGPGQHG